MNLGLSLNSVSISIAEKALLPELSVTIAPGEILTVMGPSGSGKSTFLAYLSGTLDPAFVASGGVVLDGRDITGQPPERRRIGVLFQDDLLFPHLSVAGNLAFGLVSGLTGAARRERIENALAQADLAGFADRDPASLSGGQRARVSLLRTLLAEPRALLLDEPFSKLDSAMRDEFRSHVFDHCRKGGLPTILVTHDERDAVAAGGRVVLLCAYVAPSFVERKYRAGKMSLSDKPKYSRKSP